MSDKEIIEFFDAWAPLWDERMVIDKEVIQIILNCAGVKAGKDVLDVACGTGVMIPFYQSRNVKSITGIDISPEMVKIAKGKFEKDGVKFICANAANYDYETRVPSLGREDSLEEGMATHSSIPAWRIPWTAEPGGLQSIGSKRVRHD